MWPFGKKSGRRGWELRCGLAGAPAGGPRRAADAVGAMLLVLAFAGVVLVMDSWPLEPLPYRQGQYLSSDIYARVPFEVPSPARTAQAREDAVKKTPAVIFLDESTLQRIVADLKNLPGKLKTASQPAQLDEPLRKAFALEKPEQLAAFAQYADPAKADVYNRDVDRLATKLQKSRYIVTGRDFSEAYHSKDAQVVVVRADEEEKTQPKSLLLGLDSADLDRFLNTAVQPIDLALRDNVRRYLQTSFESGVPVYRLDEKATRSAEDAARNAVRTVTEPVPAGKLLVQRGAPSGPTEAELVLVAREHEAYLRARQALQPWMTWWLLLGRGGMVLTVCVLLALYVTKYRPGIVENPWQELAVAALLALMLLATKVTIGMGGRNPYLAVAAVFLAATVLTIAYSQRFALAVSGALVLLTGLQLRQGLDFLLVQWGAVAVTVFQLREVRSRGKLIETGGVTALAAFALVGLAEAAEGVPLRHIFLDACHAAGTALAGGFVAQGILPLVERVFGVVTSLTLLEWCDANKPLLKRLALEAPGTYNHSLVLGTMCEAAADAIGGRGLLARVGAYYHDVGKINKPDYFVENRAGPGSPHDRLSPSLSLLLIKGHVRDGLQLARKYGLPKVLHEFIASHHGTTLVEYFYHAAQKRREGDQRTPEEVEFRHLGPKPRSKEPAILMLADAAESSVRAMDEPTPGKIESQIHAVINRRLMDGQFDDCELTLKEVHAVETALVASLSAFYHGRIPYPPAGGDSASPAESSEPART